ncbi:chromate efflux transporter [Geitlerinema sp. PCC 9228]|jgi:chromate transporter|uniref:chromate efflux transporter n=1 Tax=Geitlerinema sp. PCC 9228 TaxID=111611 RepID=UPI0008F99379|nr:chromate efflux transporter [Geitlerinema sp. PCC 9228]
MNSIAQNKLRELAQVFFKLGVIGFGGPAAHIAMMEDEVVNRRQWISRSHFLDLVGATNLIPGPNSTEMAIHVGYTYGGLPGLLVAGVCFLLPAIVITGVLAWVYVAFGQIPQIAPLLYGIKPAVIAVIFGALWRLGKKAVKSRELFVLWILVAIILLVFPINAAVALLLGGFLGMLWLRRDSLLSWRFPRDGDKNGFWLPLLAMAGSAAAEATTSAPLWQLGVFFLKVGCILFGSGYVLVAFLEGELVEGFGWLTQQQLLDAIAIGQFTPGPVLSTSTFIGYLVSGWPGAMVATLGIFTPSFLFVLLLNPQIPRMRSSATMSAFLDAINVSAVSLMAVVTARLAVTTLFDPWDFLAIAITAIAGFLVVRYRTNAAWLVLGGAIVGYIGQQFLPA